MTKTKAKPKVKGAANGYVPRLRQLYREEILPALQKQVNYRTYGRSPGLRK